MQCIDSLQEHWIRIFHVSNVHGNNLNAIAAQQLLELAFGSLVPCHHHRSGLDIHCEAEPFGQCRMQS